MEILLAGQERKKKTGSICRYR